MTFEEKFRKYKNGELNEEEAAQVEEELEKMQVLLEYMDEEIDEKMCEPEPEITGGGEKSESAGQNLSKIVTKAINRKFRRAALGTGILVFALITALVMGLSPLLDAICFDPWNRGKSGNRSEKNFMLTMNTYMELYCGDKGWSYTQVFPEGFGRYGINVKTQLNGRDTIYPMELVRNRLFETNLSWDHSDVPFNAFTHLLVNPKEAFCGRTAEEVQKDVANLPDQIRIRTVLSFKELKNLDELTAFMEKYPTDYLFVPFCTREEEMGRLDVTGFRPYMVGECFTDSDLYDTEEYPYLTLDQYEGDGVLPAEILQKHAESMLKFMAQDERFDKIFACNIPGGIQASWMQKYKEALEYVQENGVISYGVVVNATKEELMELVKDEAVDGTTMLDSYLTLYNY